MKKIYLIAAILILSTIPAQAAVSLTLSPESHVYLTGTSTLHPYASTSTLTQIIAVLAPGNVAEATAPAPAVLVDIARRAPFQKFEVTIPVKGLKSGESVLDKNMYKALKAGDAPEIRFVLGHYEAQPVTSDNSLPYKASGQLSIAGVQKDVVLTGTARPGPDALVMDGQYELRMSDYEIKPPKLLLGAIKVADPVTIHFHLLFQLTKGASK